MIYLFDVKHSRNMEPDELSDLVGRFVDDAYYFTKGKVRICIANGDSILVDDYTDEHGEDLLRLADVYLLHYCEADESLSNHLLALADKMRQIEDWECKKN